MLLAWGAAGAIVNVAVAWGCVVKWPANDPFADYDYEHRELTGVESLAILQFSNPHSMPIDLAKTYGVSARTFGWTTYWVGFEDDITVVVFGGWPAYAVRGCRHTTVDFSPPPARKFARSEYRGVIDVSDSDQLRLLPYTPIWPGFAINTVFYAVVLWMLSAVPIALRKRRRIKRGWCPKCAYDLRGRAPGSKACPECGIAVAVTTTPREGRS
jgi:hypothetical protein